MVKIIVFCMTFISMTYGTILRIKNGKVSGLFFLLTFWHMSRALFEVSRAFSRIPQKCHGHFFFVTGKNMRFLSRANQKLSRAFFAVKLSRAFFRVTCIFWSILEKVSRATENVSRGKKTLPWNAWLLHVGEKHQKHKNTT